MYSPHTSFFFFNDTATTEIYTLSLHDALPIFGSHSSRSRTKRNARRSPRQRRRSRRSSADRKSTRLNSSHMSISYAVFCLKKKNFNKNLHPCLRTISHTDISSCTTPVTPVSTL